MGLEGACGDTLTTVTYVQAWSYWASGGPDNECLVLWGMSLRWWGRIGQLVAFTGSLLLVADLVDLPGIAESFREARSSVKERATAARENLTVIVVVSAVALGFFIWVPYTLVGWAQSFECWANSNCPQQTWESWLQDIGEAVIISIVSVGGGLALALLFVIIGGFVIPEIILAPLMWVLRTLPRWAKAINLLLIIVAFHFSLLAS